MADTKISGLTAAAAANLTDMFAVADGTAISKKLTLQQVSDLIGGGGGGAAAPSAIGSLAIVTPTRVVGGVYQNTTAKWLLVFVFGGGAASLTAYTDAANPPTTAVAGTTQNNGGWQAYSLTFLVKPGDFYTVTGSSPGLTTWAEGALAGTLTDSGVLTRALGTTYRNTSASPMLIVMWTSGGGTVAVVSDSNAAPTQKLMQRGSGGAMTPVFAVILPGDYYQITGGAIGNWREYIWTGVSAQRSPNLASVVGGLTQAAIDSTSRINSSTKSVLAFVTGTAGATGTLWGAGGAPPSVAAFTKLNKGAVTTATYPVLGAISMSPGPPMGVIVAAAPGEGYAVWHDSTTPNITEYFEFQLTVT